MDGIYVKIELKERRSAVRRMIPVYLSMLDSEGDRRSFEELYNKYKERVAAICRKYLKQKEHIEDACSETFFSLARVYDRIKDIEPQKMDYYIFITAKNSALHVLSKEKDSMNNVSIDDIADTMSEEKLDAIDTEILTECIKKLSLPDKEILYLRVTSDLDFKTIGKMLNIKPNAARQRFQRAKYHLSKMIEGADE